MPCYLVISIHLKDPVLARKAAAELGLVEDKDYTMWGTQFCLRQGGTEKLNQVKQWYGVLETESRARRKGYSVRRQTLESGTIEVTLRN